MADPSIKRTVMVLTPCYSGVPEMPMLHALSRVTEYMAEKGVAVLFDRMVRNSLVSDARNGLSQRFLDHPDKPTHAIWWDDDVEPMGEGGIGPFTNLLGAAIKYNLDFVVGAYRFKTEDEAYPINWTLERQELKSDPETGLLEVKLAAMGFSCLSRKGVEQMCRAYPRTYRQHHENLDQRVHCLFDVGLPPEGDYYWGEDNWYCDRWRKIGGQIWVDAELTMGHWGWIDPLNPQLGKKNYIGHFGNYLRDRPDGGFRDVAVQEMKKIARGMGFAVDDAPVALPTVDVTDWTPDPNSGSFDFGLAVGKMTELAAASETKIVVCIPTRGKPEYLERFLDMSAANCILKNTKFVIGVDADDYIGLYGDLAEQWSDRVIVSVKDREDALGAKYNRCAREIDADIYIMGLDDVGIATKGWDLILAQAAAKAPNGIGAYHFGEEPHGEYLPSFIAWTKKLCELADGFCPEIFPFWWNNTWNYEIAELAGIITELKTIQSAYPETFPAPARTGILYWARVFDELRDVRVGIARRVLAANGMFVEGMVARDSPHWPAILKDQLRRNSKVRDPAFCKTLERDMSLPETDMARHIRLRARAEVMLPGIGERNAADLKAPVAPVVSAYAER